MNIWAGVYEATFDCFPSAHMISRQRGGSGALAGSSHSPGTLDRRDDRRDASLLSSPASGCYCNDHGDDGLLPFLSLSLSLFEGHMCMTPLVLRERSFMPLLYLLCPCGPA